ncbi:MAG: hypothetical protein Q8R76_07570 [Candidatus Omnitrophota bacterium]|nr:hypothetical protein [Candidatus Omnitrophota bacterium]
MNSRGVLPLIIIALFLSAGSSDGLAAEGQDWVQALSRGANSLARGDYSSALYQAVPSGKYQSRYAPQVAWNQNNVSMHQPIPGLNRVGGNFVNLNGGYDARANVSLNGRPTINQSANLGTNNKYFNTNTTFSRS